MQDHVSIASGEMAFPAPLKRQKDNVMVMGQSSLLTHLE
jgi:hypothetical protein